MERLSDEQVQKEINEPQTNQYPKLSIVTNNSRNEEEKNESSCAASIESENVNTHFYKDWLMEYLGQPLKMGLGNMAMRKPKDPVEYLALWLLNYQKHFQGEQWGMKSPTRETNEANSPVPQVNNIATVEEENKEENLRNWEAEDNESDQSLE